MTLQIRRIQAWCGEIPDRPGAAAGKLANLDEAGAELEFIFTRPNRNKPDQSVLFLAPITGPQQMEAARKAGLGPALDVAMLCVEGDTRPGISYDIMAKLAIAGINLRGISVSCIGRRFAAYLAFDDVDVMTTAIQILVTID
jgi:prephenate dehydratase